MYTALPKQLFSVLILFERTGRLAFHDPAQPKSWSVAGLYCHIQFKSQEWYPPQVLSTAGREERAAAVCSFLKESCRKTKPSCWLSGTKVMEQSQFFTLNNSR